MNTIIDSGIYDIIYDSYDINNVDFYKALDVYTQMVAVKAVAQANAKVSTVLEHYAEFDANGKPTNWSAHLLEDIR